MFSYWIYWFSNGKANERPIIRRKIYVNYEIFLLGLIKNSDTGTMGDIFILIECFKNGMGAR